MSILAWQPGNSNYNAAASVQQSFHCQPDTANHRLWRIEPAAFGGRAVSDLRIGKLRFARKLFSPVRPRSIKRQCFETYRRRNSHRARLASWQQRICTGGECGSIPDCVAAQQHRWQSAIQCQRIQSHVLRHRWQQLCFPSVIKPGELDNAPQFQLHQQHNEFPRHIGNRHGTALLSDQAAVV